MKVLFVVGTRPEVIKIFSTVYQAYHSETEFRIFMTNQHSTYEMIMKIWEDLCELYQLDFGQLLENFIWHSHTKSSLPISNYLNGITEIKKVHNFSPNIITALGDTDSVVIAALAAKKSNTYFVHIEAGCRSFDHQQPEEQNRRIADILADLNLYPSNEEKEHLLEDKLKNIPSFQVGFGNIDPLFRWLETIPTTLNINEIPPVIFTIHRHENLHPKRLPGILKSLDHYLEEMKKCFINNIPPSQKLCIFPVHPHTQEILTKSNINTDNLTNILFTKPLGYLELLQQLYCSEIVITDSGGIIIEAAYLGKPIIVIRSSSEFSFLQNIGILKLRKPDEILKTGRFDNYSINEFLEFSKFKDIQKNKAEKVVKHYGIGTHGLKVWNILQYYWRTKWQ